MKRLFTLRRVVFGGLLALGSLATFGTTAQAGGYGYGHQPRCHYEWVVCYETRQVPYTQCITLYDHCGYPYQVTKTFWRTIQVPVKKQVLVCD